MNNEALSQQLSKQLDLERRPIAVAFVESQPDGVEQSDAAVPSACTFWVKAEAGVFYATPEQHHNCPIGAMTMGLPLPSDVEGNLMGLVQKMVHDQYISEGEPPSMPSVGKPKAGIVYGPLDELPIDADLILLWLDPSQAMVFNEAAGSAAWADSMTPTVFGRPSCAALPVALGEERPTMSLGCVGMRTFTAVGSETMLGVVPAAQAEGFMDALDTTVRANDEMRRFYEGHKAQFA
jgi:uncharacterized protein (DUF169 family)